MMNLSIKIVKVGVLAASSMLGACAGARMVPASLPGITSPQLQQNPVIHGVNQTRNWISPSVRASAKKGGLLFVADNFNNQIGIYPQTKPMRRIGTIANGVASPTGLAVDGSGNLYVANYSANSVVVYAPPYTAAPTRIYTGGFYGPVAVAVGANGAVYISDYADGLLAEFLPHRTKASHIISLTGRPTGLALDESDNLFVAYESYTAFSGVLEFRSGSIRFADTGIRVGFAGGLTFDSRGNLLLEDESGGAQSINVYPPGSTTPSRIITNGFLNPISLAFNAQQSRLYVADAGALDVESITYPSAKIRNTIEGFGGPYGVALSPAAPQ